MNKDVIKIASLTKKISPKAQSVKMKLEWKDLARSMMQLDFRAAEMGNKNYKI